MKMNKITDNKFPIPKDAITELVNELPYGSLSKIAEMFPNMSKPTVYMHAKPGKHRYRIDIVLAMLYTAENHRKMLKITEKLKMRVFMDSLFEHYIVTDSQKKHIILKPFIS